MNKELSRTANGKIFMCSHCDKLHIEYNNFEFSFNPKEFNYFTDCINRIDGEYYEALNSNSPYSRKVIVPIGHRNISMLLSRSELNELKQLLNYSSGMRYKQFLTSKEISASVCENLN